MSARCPIFNIPTLLSVSGALFLAICGSTVLNMWYDRDIDAKMKRTCYRPLSSGHITSQEALRVGLILSAAGVTWALLLDLLFGILVFVGFFTDVIIYTIWLKRRTCWSIIWGGLSGAMPVIAGRAIATGTVDWIGIFLGLGILFWIPTHILTFNMHYYTDYEAAGIPTFPSTYGFRNTRLVIAIASVFAALIMAMAGIGLGMHWGYIRLLAVISAGLFLLAISSIKWPSQKLNFGLFKYASLYMLGSMVLMVL